ncbi:PTS transporter subunit EIIC [Faecalibacillus intestinalis]|uniref:PTS transporter subunit EIIC n=1 Tax=Faecalibacillus intestinalis TaxID=1982626 RepID=UPI0035200395
MLQPLFDNTKYIKISMEWLGAKGMFVAIIISIFSIKIYSFAIKKGWTIKMPDSVPPIEVLQSFFITYSNHISCMYNVSL